MGIIRSKRELTKRAHHFKDGFVLGNIRMVTAVCATTEEAIREVLPEPLEVGPMLSVFAYIAEFGTSSFCSPYSEGAIFVSAKYKDEVGTYCLSMPVTNDMAMIAGRETYGYPKKIAETISVERNGNNVYGKCIRRGIPIIEIRGELSEVLQETSSYRPHFLVKSIADERGIRISQKPLLVRQHTEVLKPGKTERGDGTVVFGESIHDPFHEIPITQVLMVSYTEGLTIRLRPGTILEEIDAEKYTPYSMMKYDWDFN